MPSIHDQGPADVETIEAEFMYQYLSGTPEQARRTLGIATTRIGGGVAVSMRNDPTGYWSKALGLGVTEPVTERLLERVLDFYRAEDNDFAVLQIRPDALPAGWPAVRQRLGLREGSRMTKLSGPAAAVPPARTDLRVGPVPPESLGEWATVVLTTFGMTADGLRDMLMASAGPRRFRPFAAWDGDRIVAGANLFIRGDVASLNSGATAPSHRSRGAQAALVHARAQAAVAAGCRWVVAETGTPGPGESNQSLNNMHRAGLRTRYVRQNWIWEAKPDR
jgi:GNAT acetyltransferase-like protein